MPRFPTKRALPVAIQVMAGEAFPRPDPPAGIAFLNRQGLTSKFLLKAAFISFGTPLALTTIRAQQ